jgi:hypothetical protein
VATGIDIPDEQIAPLLDYFNGILEERVGEVIVENLDEPKIIEFEQLQETASEEDISKWLISNIPNIEILVQDEVDALLGEAVEHHDAFSSQ